MRILDFTDGFESTSAPTSTGVPATDVAFTPAGSIAATNVQAAIVEVDSDVTTHIAATVAHGATGAVVGTTNAQVLTNKDIDGGTASNTRRITLPKDTKANLDALTRKEGTLWYASDEDKVYYDDGSTLTQVGSGSGSGGINYITETDGESASTIWTVYTDTVSEVSSGTLVDEAADSILISSHGLRDGSRVHYVAAGAIGGLTTNTTYYVKVLTANTFQLSLTLGGTAINLTSDGTGTHEFRPLEPINGTAGGGAHGISRTQLFEIREVGEYTLTKNAVQSCGGGATHPFTIHKADQGRPLRISFDYKIGSGTYSDGDITVWIYDVTNSRLIQPTGSTVLNNTGIGLHIAEFQASIDSTSYRLLLHISDTDTTAFTFRFDNVVVGPDSKSYGAPVTDWTSYTPVTTWVTNATATGKWRRLGDSMQVMARVVCSGAPTSANLTIALPTGYTIDTTKTLVSTQLQGVFGSANMYDNGTQVYTGSVVYQSTTQVEVATASALNAGRINQVSPFTFGNLDEVDVIFIVPIVGWSSNLQMSSDTDTRVVALRTSGSVASVTSGNIIVFPGVNQDTHGGYSIVTGRYTVPVSGYYLATVFLNGTNPNIGFRVYVNASGSFYIGYTQGVGQGGGSALIYANAGDLIDIRPDGTTGALTSFTHFTLNRISGPATIAASEKIYARYTTVAGQSIPNSTFTIVDFGTKISDSHNAVTTGAAFKFTAQRPGYFRLTSSVVFNSVWVGQCTLSIFKNGVFSSEMRWVTNGTVASGFISDTIYLLAGEYIDMRLWQNSGSAQAMWSSTGQNNITIESV